MTEFNLLKSFPKINREHLIGTRTEENRTIARKFNKEFFDGERINGYGGYNYDGRWIEVAKLIQKRYKLEPGDTLLDVGCAKGFLITDCYNFSVIDAYGIDISEYAINNCINGFKPRLIIGDAKNLPYADKSFSCVISINTIHNLNLEDCKKAIREMIRVCKTPKKMFIQVDAFRNIDEYERMKSFNLTAKTILHVDDWLKLFKEVGYKGDYYFTII